MASKKYSWDDERYDEPAKPEPMRTVPPKDPAALAAKIKAGEFPLPGGPGTAWEALKESNQAVGENLATKTLAGVPGRVLGAAAEVAPEWMKSDRAQPLPERGKSGQGITDRPEDILPGESTLSSIPAAALDTAAVGGIMGKAGEAIAQAPGALARAPSWLAGKAGAEGLASKLAVSGAQQAVRPSIQGAASAAGAGLGYGAADAALRGGDLGEVVEGGLTGAAGSALMSKLPQAASVVDDALSSAIRNRTVAPMLKGTATTADKAQLALGKGNKLEGKKKLGEVLEREGLDVVARKEPETLHERLKELKNDDFSGGAVGKIRTTALEASDNLSVPMVKIKEALFKGVPKGTPMYEDVERTWVELQKRAQNIAGNDKTPQHFPVPNLFKNAQEYGSAGWNKGESQWKSGESARHISDAIRNTIDTRIGEVYKKRPDLARKALGWEPAEQEPPRLLETGEINPDHTNFQAAKKIAAKDAKDARARGEEPTPLETEAAAGMYDAGKQRYSELAAIEPLANRVASRAQQGRESGIDNMLRMARKAGSAAVQPSLEAARFIARKVAGGGMPTGGTYGKPGENADLLGRYGDDVISGAILARFGQEGLDAYETELATLRKRKEGLEQESAAHWNAQQANKKGKK